LGAKHSPDTRAPLPLSLNHSPFCFSFALFPPSVSGTGAGAVGAGTQGARALLDPAGLEATLAEGMLSIALNAQREICVLHKGAPPIVCTRLEVGLS
jgi:exosome complex component RRP45